MSSAEEHPWGEIIRGLSRCPRCQIGTRPAPDGRCPECRHRSAPARWESCTSETPLQVEEENGGACRDCGMPVWVLPPKRRPFKDPAYWIALVTSIPAAQAALHTQGGTAPLSLIPFFLLFGVPFLATVLYRFFAAWPRRVRSNPVVICEECATVRIGDEFETRRFVRSRERYRRLRMLLLVTLLFLLVAVIARWVATGVPRTELLVYSVVGIAFMCVDVLGHLFFRPPELLSEHIFPR